MMSRIMSEPPQQNCVDAEEQEDARADREIDEVVQSEAPVSRSPGV
jgi:hypothetical protein